MPDRVRETLHAVRARARWRHALLAAASAGAAWALGVVIGRVALGWASGPALVLAALAGVVVGAFAWFRNRVLTLVDAAVLVERASGGCDNLVISAADLMERPRPVHPEIERAVSALAEQRVAGVMVKDVLPLAQVVGVCVAVAAGCVLVARLSSTSVAARVGDTSPVSAQMARTFSVRITPPAYALRSQEVLAQPVQVTALAGSQIRVVDADGGLIREWIADSSTSLEVPVGGAAARFLSIVVIPDTVPSVRVVAPGKDSAFVEPKGRVPIEVDALDDLGLASLVIRYTKASGGGENVTFTEGDLPARIDRDNTRRWRAHADLVLDALNLADGDVLVYRAVARDSNPAGHPVASEPFVVEIGKNAMLADAGFALPAEDKKYAISQQMVIYKTEQLLAKGRVADALEQSRGIAVEQRMVRAEVVFLGGGEVEDELEEAASSNELVEGRLQNSGRVEMLRAINAMSRAEAQLNDGRVSDALVLEKQALASLERALDRRRYFLRTLPDRSRIDTSRRLTGERRQARSWTMDPSSAEAQASTVAARRVMRELAQLSTSATQEPGVSSRLVAIDPSSRSLQQAAAVLASASTDGERRAAAVAAMQAVAGYAMANMRGSVAVTIPDASLAGALGERLQRRPQP